MTWKLIQVVVSVLLLASLTLPFVGERPVVSVGVWLLAFMSWFVNASSIRAAAMQSGGRSIVEVFPFVMIGQLVLDRLVPDLGSAIVLFGNLAATATIVRDSDFPSATVVCRDRARHLGP